MNTEYSIGNIRIRFESRARRRWFVVLVYGVLAVFSVVWGSAQSHAWLLEHAVWIVSGGLILVVALLIVFSYLTADMRMRGDERETHRREHAYARAYRFLMYFLVAVLFANFFRGPNPITPILPLDLQAFLKQLPYVLLVATFILYFTLPQAILLWTEPDMEADPEAVTQ